MAASPSPSAQAAELIARLRSARSPLARARVVIGAWRTVRSLSPRDRSDLVTQLGLEGADDLVEVIAAHQGSKPPVELIQAVNQMQKLDPDDLQSVVRRMRDPRRRSAAIQEGLKALETLEANLAGPPPGPPAGFTASRPAAPAPPAPPVPAQPAPVTVMPAASWPLRAATPSPQPQPAPSPVAAPAAPAPALAPEPPKPAGRPAPVQPAPAAEPAAAAAVRASLAEELAAVPVLTSRFRLLRRRLAAARRLSPAELRGVVEAFEDGWARRRALSELLEAGLPARAADALALVDTLQSPGDRTWCLGTLADSRLLSSEEKAALLQAAPTPAGRRRLGLRLEDA